MNDKVYKKQNKMAACTEAPWKSFIPLEIREQTLLKIKQESLDIYGQDLSGECPKRLVCFSKECIGRPLPLFSPTAKPYLDQLTETQIIINDELYITTNCQGCPIVKTCSSSCNQINDFIQRDRTQEPEIAYKDFSNEEIQEEYSEESEALNLKPDNIPWDCLNELRTQIVKLYLYEQKDFKHVANLLNLSSQAACKYEFYAALTQLSETAVIRKAIKDAVFTWDKEYYLLDYLYEQNLTQAQFAKEHGITKQAVSSRLNRIIKKYNIKWTKFVKKKGNKVIYNVPMIMK